MKLAEDRLSAAPTPSASRLAGLWPPSSASDPLSTMGLSTSDAAAEAAGSFRGLPRARFGLPSGSVMAVLAAAAAALLLRLPAGLTEERGLLLLPSGLAVFCVLAPVTPAGFVRTTFGCRAAREGLLIVSAAAVALRGRPLGRVALAGLLPDAYPAASATAGA